MRLPRVLMRLAGADHLTDADLLAARGSGLAPEHLEHCERCRTRAAALASLVDEVAAAAVLEADAAFPPDRLADQQARLLRRLEKLAHPARVIAFPGVARAVQTRRARTRRWVGAAVAAAMLVGLVAGLAVDLHPKRVARVSADAAPEAEVADAVFEPVGRRLEDPGALSDELFLRELEAAALRPHVEALQALDALTPHVREVRASLVR